MNYIRNMGYSLLVLLSQVSSSQATMPELTDKPRNADIKTCLKWATKQSQDAKDMWAVLPNATSSTPVAILRLAAYCLGDDVPDIVGAMSSAGAMDTYCESKPPETKICKQQ